MAIKLFRELRKSQTSTNEHDEEIPKKRYKFTEERQKIIDDIRLI